MQDITFYSIVKDIIRTDEFQKKREFKQHNMILHHMFPLRIVPPKTRAVWLVCYYDKVAAICERLKKKYKS